MPQATTAFPSASDAVTFWPCSLMTKAPQLRIQRRSIKMAQLFNSSAFFLVSLTLYLLFSLFLGRSCCPCRALRSPFLFLSFVPKEGPCGIREGKSSHTKGHSSGTAIRFTEKKKGLGKVLRDG
jgi:hypothetical protein